MLLPGFWTNQYFFRLHEALCRDEQGVHAGTRLRRDGGTEGLDLITSSSVLDSYHLARPGRR